jgi:cell shape-determining protein MreD
MKTAAWIVGLLACAAYAVILMASRGTARDFGPVFVVLTLAAWGYLTQHQERDRARRR